MILRCLIQFDDWMTPLEAGRRGLNVITLDPDTQQVVGVALIVWLGSWRLKVEWQSWRQCHLPQLSSYSSISDWCLNDEIYHNVSIFSTICQFLWQVTSRKTYDVWADPQTENTRLARDSPVTRASALLLFLQSPQPVENREYWNPVKMRTCLLQVGVIFDWTSLNQLEYRRKSRQIWFQVFKSPRFQAGSPAKGSRCFDDH